MAHAEKIFGDEALELDVERQEAEGVGDTRAALADALGGGFLREIEIADEARVTVRLFDRVEAFAL